MVRAAYTPEERIAKRRESRRLWKLRNPEKVKEANRRWESTRARSRKRPQSAADIAYRKAHRAVYSTASKKWYTNNKPKVRASQNTRYRSSIHYRISRLLRARFTGAVKQQGKKKSSNTTLKFLGMELPEFKIYIQGQFRPGMTWENHGVVWEFDHVIPCANFDLTDPEQQKICFRWDNFQPLFKAENRQKGARVLGQ